MKMVLRLFGVLMIAIGAVWIGQGAGYVGGSFMTNDPTWLYIGIALALLGVGLLAWSGRRAR